MKRILKILVSFIFLLACVYMIGNYLIGEMQIWQGIPQSKITHREEIIQYRVLRLEPCEYYTVHLGSYDDLAECQKKINELAQLGYRAFVAQELPYKIRLGCFAEEINLEEIPSLLCEISQEVYLEKRIYNQQSLRFSAEDIFLAEQLAPLIVGYDVLLQHSLEMLQNSSFTVYSSDIWQQMLAQTIAEANELLRYLTVALHDTACSEKIAKELTDLQLVTASYIDSLEHLAKEPTDLLVWLVQSYLLEVLEQYEETVTATIE